MREGRGPLPRAAFVTPLVKATADDRLFRRGRDLTPPEVRRDVHQPDRHGDLDQRPNRRGSPLILASSFPPPGHHAPEAPGVRSRIVIFERSTSPKPWPSGGSTLTKA
jgi:hypothetical protein